MKTTVPTPADAEVPIELAQAPDLAAFVHRAWNLHAEQPAAVAAALSARADHLPCDEGGAGTIGLAEHVWLAHLGNPEALRQWLERVPASMAQAEPGAGALRRARWAAAHADAADASNGDLPAGARWRALQNVWAVWVQRGQAERARQQLEAEWPVALAHPDAAATRALAATCNNTTVELRCGARGDRDTDALMLAAAEASRRLWGAVGTWIQAERAEYQLARCHAVLGQGARALAHARACHDFVQAHADDPQADAFERFYAHEALAWAHLASGDGAAATAECDRLRELLDQVADPASRAWAAGDLRALESALPPPLR